MWRGESQTRQRIHSSANLELPLNSLGGRLRNHNLRTMGAGNRFAKQIVTAAHNRLPKTA